jgi:xanthosine phosphorylase
MLSTSSPELVAKFIKEKHPDFTPEIGIILGSGLGALADLLDDKHIIPYESLDGFPVSTVSGHAGKMVLGYLHNVPVVCLQGRVHGYEGTSGDKIKLMIRTLKLLGCHTYFATNAAGSLRAEVAAGELVAITDHIHFQPSNPLVGANDDAFGPRFVSMDDVYDKTLREYLHQAAKKIEVPLHEGVYLSTLGPVFETPAEIRAFKILGADVVGMSTVPEVMVAKHCGMRVVVVSVITNLAAGMSDEKLSHEGTLHYANMASQRLCRLVSTFMDIYAHAKS